MNIREANLSDALGIAKVQVTSWRTAYKRIISDDYLQKLSVQDRERTWRQLLGQKREGFIAFVAEDENREIIGFAEGGRERTGKYPKYNGELSAIYLLPEAQRKGIGSMLLRRMLEFLLQKKYGGMLIWVLADNGSARCFYESFGAKVIDSALIQVGEGQLQEVAYAIEFA